MGLANSDCAIDGVLDRSHHYIITLLLQRADARKEREKAEERYRQEQDKQREDELKTYIDSMQELLSVNGKSRANDVIRNLARVRTVTILFRLDARRIGSVFTFLRETKLMSNDPNKKSIVNLNGADLTRINFCEANLTQGDFTGANLIDANLQSAILREANFMRANLTLANLDKALLTGAKLTDAILTKASLHNALLNEADLTGADFKDADLTGAILKDAILTGANFTGANISQVDTTGAINPNFSGAKTDYNFLTQA